jgi:hypothetical protein
MSDHIDYRATFGELDAGLVIQGSSTRIDASWASLISS